MGNFTCLSDHAERCLPACPAVRPGRCTLPSPASARACAGLHGATEHGGTLAAAAPNGAGEGLRAPLARRQSRAPSHMRRCGRCCAEGSGIRRLQCMRPPLGRALELSLSLTRSWTAGDGPKTVSDLQIIRNLPRSHALGHERRCPHAAMSQAG